MDEGVEDVAPDHPRVPELCSRHLAAGTAHPATQLFDAKKISLRKLRGHAGKKSSVAAAQVYLGKDLSFKDFPERSRRGRGFENHFVLRLVRAQGALPAHPANLIERTISQVRCLISQ